MNKSKDKEVVYSTEYFSKKMASFPTTETRHNVAILL